jgi:hypothetical protein
LRTFQLLIDALGSQHRSQLACTIVAPALKNNEVKEKMIYDDKIRLSTVHKICFFNLLTAFLKSSSQQRSTNEMPYLR